MFFPRLPNFAIKIETPQSATILMKPWPCDMRELKEKRKLEQERLGYAIVEMWESVFNIQKEKRLEINRYLK